MYAVYMADDWPLFDDDGEDFERPNPVSRWRAPLSVSRHPAIPGVCQTEVLIFDYAEPSADSERWCEVNEGLLRTFARLADAPTTCIVGFARRWGALSLMGIGYRRHTIPRWETVPWLIEKTNMPRPPEAPGIVWESVVQWRWAARVVYRVLKLSAHLRNGFAFEDDDVSYLRRDSLSILYDIANWNTPDEQAVVRETARARRAYGDWLVEGSADRPYLIMGGEAGLFLARAQRRCGARTATGACHHPCERVHRMRWMRGALLDDPPTTPRPPELLPDVPSDEDASSDRRAQLSGMQAYRRTSRHPRKCRDDSPLGSSDI
jgi:hypothetical protein